MVASRDVALALLVAGAAFGTTSVLYQRSGDIVVDFERAYEGGMIAEFHPREKVDGKFVRWTKDESFLSFHHLPGTGELSVEAHLRVRRPAGSPLPNLAFTVNGATVHTTPGFPGAATYHFTFPSTSPDVRLGIRSDTFDPDGSRALGVQVLRVIVRLSDRAPSSSAPAAWMAAATLLLFAAARIASGSGVGAAGAAITLSAVFGYLLSQHAVRFSHYPREVALLAGATLLFAWLARRAQHDPRRLVTCTLAAIFLVEMGVAFYPLTETSDADFQANRMQIFLDGDWHPTSVTQHVPPFRIPYPVSLYAVTAPLVALGAEPVTALTATTAAFDVLVSIVLLWLGWRFFDDVRGGALAALLYQLVPMNALGFSAGNFTNLFAVAMLALAFALWFERPIACATATLLALTAHVGMLIEGAILWPAWLAAAWLGPAPVKDGRKRLSVALGVSFVLAATYYLGYAELITDQMGRAFTAGADGGTNSGGTGGWRTAVDQLGWIFLAVAALGGLSLVRSPRSTTFRTMALVWLAVSLAFVGFDLVSAVEIRYALQALPLLALLAGVYLSNALDRGRLGMATAWAAILYIGVMGMRTLHDVALFQYH